MLAQGTCCQLSNGSPWRMTSNLPASQLRRQCREEATAGQQAVSHPDGNGQIEQPRRPARQHPLARSQLLRLQAGETQQCLARAAGRFAGIERTDEHGLAGKTQAFEGARQRLPGSYSRRQAGEIPPQPWIAHRAAGTWQGIEYRHAGLEQQPEAVAVVSQVSATLQTPQHRQGQQQIVELARPFGSALLPATPQYPRAK